MAHVRAVGQVVGAERPDEQLVGVGGLVGGTSGRVEDRLVRRVERAEFGGDQVEGVVPADGFVVSGALAQHHRFAEASLLAQPVVGPLRQVGHGVPGEEVGPDSAGGGLLGDRLGAVLAELGGVAVGRVGPGASGAVESGLLVDRSEGQRRADGPHLPVRHAERPDHRRDAGHHGFRLVDADVRITRVVSRRLRHGLHLLRVVGRRPARLVRFSIARPWGRAKGLDAGAADPAGVGSPRLPRGGWKEADEMRA